MQDIKNQITNYFKGLEFEENSHKYSLNSKPISISVSGLIKKYTEEFDSKNVSLAISKKTGINVKEIIENWKKIKDDACTRGNNAHIFGENYVINNAIKINTKLDEAIVKFWKELPIHIVPVNLELQMYHKTIMFAGTADIILYNTLTNKFIICDYKTNLDIFKNYKNKKLLSPFNNLLDCPYSKYELQLSYYQILFEQTGFEVESRKLIWLKDDGDYYMYDLKDYTEILSQELLKLKL